MKRKILTSSLAIVLCASTVLTSAFTSNAFENEKESIQFLKSPEGVENKDIFNQDVRNEEIASTNETKPSESIDRVKSDRDIVVAILDSGLNASDEIFDGRIIADKNFIDGKDTSDIYGHGTVMSRIVLDNAMSNEQNQVKIMPIKVLNDEGVGTTLSAYKGIKYAIEKKVDVINLSMAGIGHSKLLETAINEAYNNRCKHTWRAL